MIAIRFGRALLRSVRLADTLFRKQGLFKSIVTGQSVDADGKPIPWMTYPAIEYLRQFDFSTSVLFEYGCGQSSLYWASRFRRVISVEDDVVWHSSIAAQAPANLKVALETQRNSYVNSIATANILFDVVVVDGKWRNDCLLICPKFTQPHGIIILDNSDRHYEQTRKLRERGYFQVDFSGFCPINLHTSTTSIFIRSDTRLQERYSEPDPVGGLREKVAADD